MKPKSSGSCFRCFAAVLFILPFLLVQGCSDNGGPVVDAENTSQDNSDATDSSLPDHAKNNTIMVAGYELPDPLVLANGESVLDSDTWVNQRRPEILRLFEEHQEGVTPDAILEPRYDMVEENALVLNETACRTQLRIRFSDEPDTVEIRVMLHIPENVERPVPTLLHIGFSPSVLIMDEPGIDEGLVWSGQTHSWIPDRDAPFVGEFDIAYFVNRGYAVAYVYYGDIDPDHQDGAPYGIRQLFGSQTQPREPNEWGTIGSWSWGLSRILDYLETHPEIDGTKIALSGVSRLGKTVLWAAAQDERFALVIPSLSGEGGAAISRRKVGESIADLTDPERYHYWFAPRYADYANNVDALPVDGHMLIALIAPRPLLLITGSEDAWSDPEGEFIAALAAEPVYQLFGKQGLGITEFPVPETRILNDMGYYMHDDGHTILQRDYEAMADFMDKHFGY